jgi:transposase
MGQRIMVGCDLHDRSILLRVALGREAARTVGVRNTAEGRRAMIENLKAAAATDAGQVILAYEASGQGFGLYDELTAAGIEAHVLAPTKLVRSPKQRRNKTDIRDANAMLDLLRAHVLAGNELPDVWVPDFATRDARELVRTRIDAATKITRLKTQVQCLLKRNRLERPQAVGVGWTAAFRRWLADLAKGDGDATRATARPGMRAALGSLLRQLAFCEQETKQLDLELVGLAHSPRYARAVAALVGLPGVGVLTALVFLTELGDPTRFANRRALGSYLGLAPTCFESGEANDRKGHITSQGPSRVRRALCQAAWAYMRLDAGVDADAYARIVERNPKHKKIAVVAVMRRLAVKMWHRACDVWPQNGEQRSPLAASA